MENNITPALFADRYRLETVTSDWDRGRSGYTHLVSDTQANDRKAVIKRADIASPQAVQGLKNEIEALKALKGLGVPEVYETGEAIYGTKKFHYVVLEFIDALRVEKQLSSLGAIERAEILTQFFGLLAEVHRRGIVNGDVDLKHLFWRREKKELIVIDWGNSKNGVDFKKSTEFAFDFARSAEIIYALVVNTSPTPATGSLALPSDSGLLPGLRPVPVEFKRLCQWAPRAPSDGAQAPYSAAELFEISKKWLAVIRTRKPAWISWLVWLVVLALVGGSAAYFISRYAPSFMATPTPLPITQAPTDTKLVAPVDTVGPSETPLPTETATQTPESIIPTPTPTEAPTITPTFTPTVIPSPEAHTPFLNFDDRLSIDNCWVNTTNSETPLDPQEGLTRRSDKYWRFFTEIYRTTLDDKGNTIQTYSLEVDFNKCLGGQQPKAVAANIWVARLEYEREFGIYLEDASGLRHEYTLWVDNQKTMHMRVRENGQIIDDLVVLVINTNTFKSTGAFPHPFYAFPIQIYLELNNSGLMIPYLKEGPLQQAVQVGALDPNGMLRIDNAIHPTSGEIIKIGLVGYGGETQTVIWPLVFYEK